MQKTLFPENPPSVQDNKEPESKKTVSRKDLNSAQYEAVTHRDGPLLVIAGAGSGKTRTLVYRVAYLVETGVPPEQIVLLTFTRRAARNGSLTATRLAVRL